MLSLVLAAVIPALAFLPIVIMRFGIAGLALLPFIGSAFAFLATLLVCLTPSDEPDSSEAQTGL